MATTVVNPETPTSEAPFTPTPQQTERETVEQKYSRLYQQPEGQVPPVAPSPTPPPVVETPPDSSTLLLEEIRKMREELNGVKTIVTPPPPPPIPDPVVTPWFNQLREGNFAGAEQDLINRIKSAVERDVTIKAVAETESRMKVQNEVDRYLTDLRTNNPELVPMEHYLAAPVQNRIEQARLAGKVNSPDDFLREYKSAVNEEVKTLREITLKYRAQGATTATTRQTDVRGAVTLEPQQVSSPNLEGSSEPQTESSQDYFAKRRGSEALFRRMN